MQESSEQTGKSSTSVQQQNSNVSKLVTSSLSSSSSSIKAINPSKINSTGRATTTSVFILPATTKPNSSIPLLVQPTRTTSNEPHESATLQHTSTVTTAGTTTAQPIKNAIHSVIILSPAATSNCASSAPTLVARPLPIAHPQRRKERPIKPKDQLVTVPSASVPLPLPSTQSSSQQIGQANSKTKTRRAYNRKRKKSPLTSPDTSTSKSKKRISTAKSVLTSNSITNTPNDLQTSFSRTLFG